MFQFVATQQFTLSSQVHVHKENGIAIHVVPKVLNVVEGFVGQLTCAKKQTNMFLLSRWEEKTGKV